MTATPSTTSQTTLRSHLAAAWSLLNLQGTSNLRLGIWGTGGAGKTTFLSMLYDQLLISPRWTVAANTKAGAFAERHLATIFSEGVFPAPTETAEQLDLLSYHLTPREPHAGRGQHVTLTFVDAPGEFYEDPSHPASRVDAEMDIVDYLCSCHGLIFLIDPQPAAGSARGSYQDMLLRLFQEFQRRAQKPGAPHATMVQQYIAFCVTKVDRDPLWGRRDAPEELALEAMGRRLIKWMEHNFSQEGRYRYFATSAIGRYQERGSQDWVENVRPAVPAGRQGREASLLWVTQPAAAADSWVPPATTAAQPIRPEETIVCRDEIAPLNVIEPVEWLLAAMAKRMPRLHNR